MPRRPFASILALIALAACASSAQSRPAPANATPGAAPAAAPAAAAQNPTQAPAGRPNGAGQGQRPTSSGPKPYREVITAEARTDSGVFVIHRIDDKLFYEIPRVMLGREFLLVVDQRGTVRGVRYAGEETSDRIVRWERNGNRVFLRIVGYDMRADSTGPVARAVDLSNVAPIAASFDIAAFSPEDSNLVIDVTKLFTSDIQEFNIRQSRVRVRSMDASRSAIERARSFERNVEVSAIQTFAVDSVPGEGPSLNSLTMLMNYSMVLLPDQPMTPRLCDSRVGFFNLSFENYDQDRVPRADRCYIARFRLEARNPGAAVSDPVKPIIWYIDPATPAKWVPWLIRGVNMWEPIFRAAGFSNAIRAELAPVSDTFDLDDARFNTIRWLPSTVANAYGPHVSDPRSGETISANVMFYHNITDLVERWYWTQAGASDPRARVLPMPDSLMGLMLAYVAAHEVGHSIGMRHNMIASTFYPVDSLRSRSFTCRMQNTSPSIMDYARYNYIAQPEDNACLMQGFGAYDYYAIDWGYRRIPGAASPEAERPVLDSLARLQDTNPYFRWVGDGDADPRSLREQLGDNAIRASTYGFANIRRLVPMLIPATTANRTDDYTRLQDLYNALLSQWGLEVSHVADLVGGIYHTERYPSQTGAVYEISPRERQAEAVAWLNANVFTTPTYFLDADILRRLEPTGSVERLRARQVAGLNMVLQDTRLSRLAENTSWESTYGIGDLFSDLRRGLFSEASAARPTTDIYRRNLQRAFVDQMERIISTPLNPTVRPGTPPQFRPPPRPADAVALARAELRDLDTQLRTALVRTRDRETRAHFEELRARIDRILNPR